MLKIWSNFTTHQRETKIEEKIPEIKMAKNLIPVKFAMKYILLINLKNIKVIFKSKAFLHSVRSYWFRPVNFSNFHYLNDNIHCRYNFLHKKEHIFHKSMVIFFKRNRQIYLLRDLPIGYRKVILLLKKSFILKLKWKRIHVFLE